MIENREIKLNRLSNPSPQVSVIAQIIKRKRVNQNAQSGAGQFSFHHEKQALLKVNLELRGVADEALPSFQREVRDASGQVTRSPAIRFFAKPEEAPIDAVLEAVRAASPGAETRVIEPGSHGDYVLMPTGEAFDAHQRFVRGEADGPSMQCGPLGPSEAGGYTFRILEGAPDKVVMIDWGTSVPIFDPDTLRVASD